MESMLNRYRNITVLLLVLCAQLVLLAVQVRTDQDVPLIRAWTVSAVTPAARLMEGLRGGGSGFLNNYVLMRNSTADNRRLQAELDRVRMENRDLHNQLNTAERAKALAMFQVRMPSRSVPALVIGTGAGANSKMVFIDKGAKAGVARGMAVVTPDGIVGKVISTFPAASEVLLVTDADFAAGVISQKSRVHGTLRGQGTPLCRVDYVPAEEKVVVGEWLFTSGDDRIFPRGFPAGIVKVVRETTPFKEVLVEPSGLQQGVEEVLVLVEGLHQAIPNDAPVHTQVYLTPAAPGEETPPRQPGVGATDADKLLKRYRAMGESQKHQYGGSYTAPIDFNRPANPPPVAAPAYASPAAVPPASPSVGAPVKPPAVTTPPPTTVTRAAPPPATAPVTQPVKPPAVTTPPPPTVTRAAPPRSAPAQPPPQTAPIPAPKPSASGQANRTQADPVANKNAPPKRTTPRLNTFDPL